MQEEFDEGPRGGTADDRKELRWNIPIPVRVKGTGNDGKEFELETITADASPSGMCLLLTVPLKKGSQIWVGAPEEGFESPATITDVNPLGSNMSRIRVRFPANRKFTRTAAAKKYIYDNFSATWAGYVLEGTYYNSKHEPFGKVEGSRIISLESGRVMFTLRWESVYDSHGTCVGHLV